MNSASRPRRVMMMPDDELLREALDPQTQRPQSSRRTVVLVGLAALLVLTIVGTSALVLRDLRLSGAPKVSAPAAATSTASRRTPTPDGDPRNNGWKAVSGGTFADVQFTQSSGQRGYLCGKNEQVGTRLFGVTTDGGDTWHLGPSPASYDDCWLQVSATNPLDIALLSSVGPCGGGCPGFDTHYSIDGGKTWKAAPFPQNTELPAGAVWAGQYLYVWADPAPDNTEQGFLKVSVSGGSFTSIDPNSLVPGTSDVYIQQLVAGGTKVYVTVAYSGCTTGQGCTAVVASGDGGKTWTRISNVFNMHVVWVQGTTLYGQVFGSAQGPLQTSIDNGATWKQLALPATPNGNAPSGDVPGSSLPDPDGTLLPAADGTVFTVYSAGDAIAYLRSGTWTLLPFSSSRIFATFGTVTFGPDGHPQRVWVFGSSGTSDSGSRTLYWQTL